MQIRDASTSLPLYQPLAAFDEALIHQAQLRLDCLTKPKGSLGRLEELAKQIVGITGTCAPVLNQPVIITMASDHGVAEEGVSAYPQAVTVQMVQNFLQGGAAVNVLARHVGCRVIVVDMGVAADIPTHPHLVLRKMSYGTRNMTQTAAMTRAECEAAIHAGYALVEQELTEGIHLVGLGEMGIGNTTAASAIVAAMTNQPLDRVTGRGTGVDAKTWGKKLAVIQRALDVNRPDPSDPIDVLAKVGGFEIAGLVGVMLAGARAHLPIILDGFIVGAAAVIAVRLVPTLRPYLIASHLSQEPGHRAVLEYLKLRPLLELQLRLGEGTGAALAMPLLGAACKILTEMATFDQAGVSGQIR